MTVHRYLSIVLMLLSLTVLVNATAEERTITVTIPWSGEGRIYQIGPKELQFLGALEGIAYAEDASGALDEGFVSCPVVQSIAMDSAETSASGRCTIVVSGEDSVFAEFNCSGKVGGCKGDFRLTGGTGRFEGITGSSKLVIRSPLRHVAADMASGSLVRAGTGLAQLPALTFVIPE